MWKTKFAISIIVFFIMLALFAPFVAPYSYKEQFREYVFAPPTHIHISLKGLYVYRLKPVKSIARSYTEDKSKICYINFFVKTKNSFKLFEPSCGYIFLLGTDALGRDIFSRLLYALRVSLSISIIGAVSTIVIGTMIGSLAGYVGGILDNVVMRMVEILMAMPTFYLMLSIRALFPLDISGIYVFGMIVFILSFFGFAPFSRVIRGMVLSIREYEYVNVAKFYGANPFYIILKHILPNIRRYLIMSTVLSIPAYIVAEGALSFLGLGIQEPYPSLGNMLPKSIYTIILYPWTFSSAVVIFLIIVVLNLLGDSLSEKE
ncbi:ABC transporter permease [Hydrogenobaculum acidophilum]